MRDNNALVWLENRVGWLFVIAGILLAGVAVYKGVGDFTSMTVPAAVDTLYGGLALLGAAFALLGFYPHLKEYAPRLSIAGGLSALISMVPVFVVWVWFIGTTIQLGRFPAIPEEAPVWTAIALVLNFLTLSLGYLLFGVAGRRTGGLSGTVSVLLMVPAVLWIGLIVNVGVRLIPNMDFYVYVVNAAALLVIAYLIQDNDWVIAPVDPMSDSVS